MAACSPGRWDLLSEWLCVTNSGWLFPFPFPTTSNKWKAKHSICLAQTLRTGKHCFPSSSRKAGRGQFQLSQASWTPPAGNKVCPNSPSTPPSIPVINCITPKEIKEESNHTLCVNLSSLMQVVFCCCDPQGLRMPVTCFSPLWPNEEPDDSNVNAHGVSSLVSYLSNATPYIYGAASPSSELQKIVLVKE